MPFYGLAGIDHAISKTRYKTLTVFCSIVTLKVLRLNYFSTWEITCGKYCPVMELRFTDILFPCLKLGNVVKHLSVKKKQKKTVNLAVELSFTIKLGQRRSGELRGFSTTQQSPRELGVFSDVRTTKSRKLRGFSGVGDAHILHRK